MEKITIKKKAGTDNLYVVNMTVTKRKLLVIYHALELRIEQGSPIAQDVADMLFAAAKENGIDLSS